MQSLHAAVSMEHVTFALARWPIEMITPLEAKHWSSRKVQRQAAGAELKIKMLEEFKSTQIKTRARCFHAGFWKRLYAAPQIKPHTCII